MEIQYFDNYLIGISFRTGYRIKFNNNEIDKYDIINFMSDTFGEGFVKDDCIIHDTWVIRDKKDKFVLILKTEKQLNKLKQKFNITSDIDYNSLSSYVKLKDQLLPFIGRPNNQKNKNKIREIIRQILYTKPYDFNLELSESGIFIKLKEEQNLLV